MWWAREDTHGSRLHDLRCCSVVTRAILGIAGRISMKWRAIMIDER